MEGLGAANMHIPNGVEVLARALRLLISSTLAMPASADQAHTHIYCRVRESLGRESCVGKPV
jgi:hypothetical protein